MKNSSALNEALELARRALELAIHEARQDEACEDCGYTGKHAQDCYEEAREDEERAQAIKEGEDWNSAQFAFATDNAINPAFARGSGSGSPLADIMAQRIRERATDLLREFEDA